MRTGSKGPGSKGSGPFAYSFYTILGIQRESLGLRSNMVCSLAAFVVIFFRFESAVYQLNEAKVQSRLLRVVQYSLAQRARSSQLVVAGAQKDPALRHSA